MKQVDKLALLDWDKYKEEIARATPVDKSMTTAERERHRLYLEKHPIEWIKFFSQIMPSMNLPIFRKKPYAELSHTTNGLRYFPGVVSLLNQPLQCLLLCSSRLQGARKMSFLPQIVKTTRCDFLPRIGQTLRQMDES